MSQPTARVLSVLELLQTHGRMRAQEIAARLEVDARTVRRYVMILRDRGMPIEMERGRYGGYRLRPGFKMPLALTEREALAVTFGLLSVRQQRVAITEADSEQALAKITRVLPSQTREIMAHVAQEVTFAIPPFTGSEPVNVESLDIVLRAAKAHVQLTMNYQSWKGSVTERIVDPYGVVYRYGRWYLVGYCHLREAQRVFRLDHICAVTARAETFDPHEVDVLAAVEESIARTPWLWEYEVVLDLSLAEAKRRVSATIATLEPHEAGVIMRGFADDLAWLAYFLVGLKCQMRIVRPPELRPEIRALAERTLALAESPM